MPKPICENLTTRPSAQPGYLEIGQLSADGQTFTLISVVGESLPRESQLYFVAAEGGCNIRGQDMVGTVAPEPLPAVVPAQPVATAAPPQQPAATAPTSNLVAPDWAVWGMTGLVIVGAIASTIRVRQAKANDKTPSKTQSITLGGNDGL